jgi:hypothetical protein
MIAGGRNFYFKESGERRPAAYIASSRSWLPGTMLTWWLGIRMPITQRSAARGARLLPRFRRAVRVGAAHHLAQTLWPGLGRSRCRRRCATAAPTASSATHLPELRACLPRRAGRAAPLDHDGPFLRRSFCSLHCARRDERVLATSALAADYAAYRHAPACSCRNSQAPDKSERRRSSPGRIRLGVPERDSNPDVRLKCLVAATSRYAHSPSTESCNSPEPSTTSSSSPPWSSQLRQAELRA